MIQIPITNPFLLVPPHLLSFHLLFLPSLQSPNSLFLPFIHNLDFLNPNLPLRQRENALLPALLLDNPTAFAKTPNAKPNPLLVPD
jgi:hypothetical protein